MILIKDFIANKNTAKLIEENEKKVKEDYDNAVVLIAKVIDEGLTLLENDMKVIMEQGVLPDNWKIKDCEHCGQEFVGQLDHKYTDPNGAESLVTMEMTVSSKNAFVEIGFNEDFLSDCIPLVPGFELQDDEYVRNGYSVAGDSHMSFPVLRGLMGMGRM